MSENKMTPREKAIELVERFEAHTETSYGTTARERAKQCALICVYEILSASTIRLSESNPDKFVYTDEYWNEVKTEIEKL